jgi:protein arginine N-methyltransferase 1
MACRLGAGHVIAVEPNEVIQVAMEIAEANSCADRITFCHDLSTAVSIPGGADVVVSDLRGILPYYEAHIASIVDARTRLLAPKGILVPRRDVIYAALVESPELYGRHRLPDPIAGATFDVTAFQRRATSTWRKAYVGADSLLSEPVRCAELDYATITDPNLVADVTLTANRPGIVHGITAWFDAELTGTAKFSNAPGKRKAIYGNAFFPLTEAVPVAAGERVSVDLRATLVKEKYIWQWNTRIEKANKHFRQSTLSGAALSLDTLRSTTGA